MGSERSGDRFTTGTDPEAVSAARRASPEGFLRQRYGADVRSARGGRSLRVEGILRSDLTRQGVWLSCDWQGGGIGDNVALVRRETGCGFAQAVELMSGVSPRVPAAPGRPGAAPFRERPRVPRRSDPDEGRAYLASRGVSPGTVSAAEGCGALSYCRGALLFLGRDLDSGEIRLAALRHLEPRPDEDGRPRTKARHLGVEQGLPRGRPGRSRLRGRGGGRGQRARGARPLPLPQGNRPDGDRDRGGGRQALARRRTCRSGPWCRRPAPS